MIKYLKIGFLFYLVLLLFISESRSQVFNSSPLCYYDTVKVKGNRYIVIDNKIYYAEGDTVCVIPSTSEFFVKKKNPKRTLAFYNKIDHEMGKTDVLHLVHRFLFKHPQEFGDIPHVEKENDVRFIDHEGKDIKDIKYLFLTIFGSDINDTTVYRPNRWSEILNNLHIHTRGWILDQNLLFEEGDTIDRQDLIDTERLLRRLNYIKDARVFIEEKKDSANADIIVATKDVFPYTLSINPTADALFGVGNINILGIGHEVQYNHITAGGSEYFYRVRNIQHSFIDGEFNYAQYFRKSGYGLNFKKDFVTQNTKYAGGIVFSRYRFGEQSLDQSTDQLFDFTYDRRFTEVWIGRAYNTAFKSRVLGFKDNTKVVTAGKWATSDFYSHPIVSADTNFRFHNTTNYLFSLGFTSRSYYKDKLILQFGRTEDIPTGSALGLTYGFQKSEFRNRGYAAFRYARGGYLNSFGYLNTVLEFGTFFDRREFTDGIVRVGVDYFSRLYTINQFRYRHFFDFSLSETIDPSEEIIITNDRELGIRGLSGLGIATTTKINAKTESQLFTPAFVLGFRVATFAFGDYTLLLNHQEDSYTDHHFFGIGGGIRMRNDNLAFPTVQVRAGYYPHVPEGISNWSIEIATSTRLSIRDFDFKAPDIIRFR